MKNFERAVVREANVRTRVQVIECIEQGKLTTQQGADLLGVTVRQIRRLKVAYRERGPDGVRDRRCGRRPGSQVNETTKATVRRLRRDLYGRFNVKHMHEHLVEKHNLSISYNWTLRFLQSEGLAEKQRRRGVYRRRRERQPMRGMRIHLDGSTHHWLGEDEPDWDLITILDDANSEMLYSQFVPEEGTMSTFAALRSVLSTKGRFAELYVDKGSHFCHIDAETKQPVHTTQVAKALESLGIRMINAHSPQARGRGERGFGTIQGRLPQELELHGITDYGAANRYLNEVFIADFNRRFMVAPQDSHSMYSALPPCDLHVILSIKETRVLRNDYTVQFDNKRLQLPNSSDKPRPRQKVTVHRFIDGDLGISHNNRLLACYQPDGTLRKTTASPQPSPTPANPVPARTTGPGDANFFGFLNSQHPQNTKALGKGGAAQNIASRNDLFIDEDFGGRTF